MFLWAPLFWDDHITHAIFFDGSKGEALVREGIVAPLYPNEAAVPGVQNSKDERMATARHRVTYHRGTRLASSAEIDLVNLAGETRTIAMEPILKFQMKGLGYGHPEWGQGMWKGEQALGHESFDPRRSICSRARICTCSRWCAPARATRRGLEFWNNCASAPTVPPASPAFLTGPKDSS